MIRSAKTEDLNCIKRLWMDAFDDEESYVDFFIRKKMQLKFTAVLEIDSEIIGMIHLLPCSVYPDKKAFYWYAVAIRSDMRGKGYFRSFLTSVLNGTQKAGYGNVCVPAKGLAPVYQKYGFPFEYRANDVVISRSEKSNVKGDVKRATAGDALSLFSRSGDLSWGEEAIAYALEENARCDGVNLSLADGSKTQLAIFHKLSDTFLLDETTMDRDEVERFADLMLDHLGTESFVFRDYAGNDGVIALSDVPILDEKARVFFTLA